MPAVSYDLSIEQGATFSFSIEWREDDGSKPPTGPLIDTTNYDAFLQIRQKPAGPLYADWSSVSESPQITVDAGVITVYVGADQTDLQINSGVYDLELHNRTDVTDVVRLIQGKVSISPQVTTTDTT